MLGVSALSVPLVRCGACQLRRKKERKERKRKDRQTGRAHLATSSPARHIATAAAVVLVITQMPHDWQRQWAAEAHGGRWWSTQAAEGEPVKLD
jgi:hypothetical protein